MISPILGQGSNIFAFSLKMYYLCILLTKNRNIMKGNLLLGTARGRMGDIVAKVIHGEQVLSKYQPNVYNPDSPAQRRQREMLSIATKKATCFK